MHVLTLIINYVVAHKTALLALVGGSGGISVTVQTLLHTAKIQGYIKSFFVSHVMAFAGALLTYAVSGTNYNVGAVYLFIWFVSQFWHALAVNPLYNKKVLPFLDLLAKTRASLAPAKTAPVEAAVATETTSFA